MTIENANIKFNPAGTPVAERYDDVYFSNTDGMREAEYVFIENNQLFERWENWPTPRFVIAETGFGTGLNFLTTAHHFLTQQARHNALRTLHFISFEKFPLQLDDLTQALSKWPTLETLITSLIAQYPKPLAGCHRLSFADGRIILDLWLGDVHQSLPQIHNATDGLIDAWFLDGFAPSKNPDMWTDALYQQMIQLSRKDATFATFTAAGNVRRDMLNAGFSVSKRKGFKHKREMLVGLIPEPIARVTEGMFYRNSNIPSAPTTLIVGGGLAAAAVAYAMVTKGHKVTLLCADTALALGASGNPQGGFYPQLQSQLNPISQLYAQTFVHAVKHYQQLSTLAPFSHQWCGVLQLAFNDNTRLRNQKMINAKVWPEHLFTYCSAQLTSQLAELDLPYEALHFADGGWINVAELVNSYITAANTLGEVTVEYQQRVETLQKHQQQWQVVSDTGKRYWADNVIIATGAETALLQTQMTVPTQPVRGQVSYVPAQSTSHSLAKVLCHKGYFTPAQQGYHTVGSSYVKQDTNIDLRMAENMSNGEMTKTALNQCEWVEQLDFTGDGRAAIRCTTPDHLPLVGAVADINQQTRQYKGFGDGKVSPEIAIDKAGLYVFSALGSRGLCTAPLLAETLASQISGEPLPLPKTLLNAVNPNRFLIRSLKRGLPYPSSQ